MFSHESHSGAIPRERLDVLQAIWLNLESSRRHTLGHTCEVVSRED